MFARASHRNIQLSVYRDAPVIEHIRYEEIQLILPLYRKAINNDVTLATLKTLNGVDSDVMQYGNTLIINGFTHGSNLIAIRNDDTNG